MADLPDEELLEPHPDIHALFVYYNSLYFEDKLGACSVEWSSGRMTLCGGVCEFQRGGGCRIKLSEPLLKLRPSRDLKMVLLHEMIHAFMMLQGIRDDDPGGHGTIFKSIMARINTSQLADHQRPPGGYNITTTHSMFAEVDHYRQHHWRCERCGNVVKRAMNRPPQEADCRGRAGRGADCQDPYCRWHMHLKHCGGSWVKMKEPEGFGEKVKKGRKKGSAAGGSSDGVGTRGAHDGQPSRSPPPAKRPKRADTGGSAAAGVAAGAQGGGGLRPITDFFPRTSSAASPGEEAAPGRVLPALQAVAAASGGAAATGSASQQQYTQRPQQQASNLQQHAQQGQPEGHRVQQQAQRGRLQTRQQEQHHHHQVEFEQHKQQQGGAQTQRTNEHQGRDQPQQQVQQQAQQGRGQERQLEQQRATAAVLPAEHTAEERRRLPAEPTAMAAVLPAEPAATAAVLPAEPSAEERRQLLAGAALRRLGAGPGTSRQQWEEQAQPEQAVAQQQQKQVQHKKPMSLQQEQQPQLQQQAKRVEPTLQQQQCRQQQQQQQKQLPLQQQQQQQRPAQEGPTGTAGAPAADSTCIVDLTNSQDDHVSPGAAGAAAAPHAAGAAAGRAGHPSSDSDSGGGAGGSQGASLECPICGQRWGAGQLSNAQLNAHVDECLNLSYLDG